MKIGLFQYDIIWEDKVSNKNKIKKMLQDVKPGSVDWIIFPEMTLTGFSMDTNKTIINLDDIEFFKQLSIEKKSFISFGGVVDSNNRNITISLDGKTISDYSKIHLFGYGDEHNHYKPGKKHESFEVKGFKVMPAICYDLRFSYLFWDNAKNVDLFFVIANWPASRRNHWVTLLKARAIENQAYIIGVNRVGADPKLNYSGDSLLIDPLGNEVINSEAVEGLFIAEISQNVVPETRQKFPFIKDRQS